MQKNDSMHNYYTYLIESDKDDSDTTIGFWPCSEKLFLKNLYKILSILIFLIINENYKQHNHIYKKNK